MTGVGVQFSAGIGPAKDREKVELKMAEFDYRDQTGKQTRDTE